MTQMSIQMSLPTTQPRPILGQPSQHQLPQQTTPVLRQSLSHLLDPRVKAMQLTERLQQGCKTMMTMSKKLSHPSFNVPIAQRRNLLWVSSSKYSFMSRWWSPFSKPSPNLLLTFHYLAGTSKLTPYHIGATSKAATSGKQHNGTSIVTRTHTERFDYTFAPFPAAHGTSTGLNSAFPDDWTMRRDISSHMPTIMTCQCYERIVKEDCSECRGGR
jgi:hypothetical protein